MGREIAKRVCITAYQRGGRDARTVVRGVSVSVWAVLAWVCLKGNVNPRQALVWGTPLYATNDLNLKMITCLLSMSLSTERTLHVRSRQCESGPSAFRLYAVFVLMLSSSEPTRSH